MPYRLTLFHSTVIKPYYKDNSFKPLQDTLKEALKDALKNTPGDVLENALKENHK